MGPGPRGSGPLLRLRPLLLGCALVAFAGVAQADETITGQVHRVVKHADGSTAPATDAQTVVVYVPDFARDAEPGPKPEMHQIKRTFVPDVLVVVKGQTVSFVNDDDIIHNVFSNSRAVGASTMDLGKYKSGTRERAFHQTGVVDLYCNIHESMAAKILVVPNPAFTKAAADGRFTVSGVPPGKHTVWAWTKHGTASAEVTVTPGRPATVELTVVETPSTDTHLDKYKKAYSTHADGYN